MKDNKIKRKLVVVFLLLALILASGMSLAFLMSSSGLSNSFSMATTNNEIIETFDGHTKKDVKIKNTGNTDVYVRTQIVVYYEYQNADQSFISNVIPQKDIDYEISLGSDWFEVDGIYYYEYPLAPNEETTNLINHIVPKTNTNEKLVVDIFTQTIQSKPDKAVNEAWKDVNVNSESKLEKVVL